MMERSPTDELREEHETAIRLMQQVEMDAEGAMDTGDAGPDAAAKLDGDLVALRRVLFLHFRKEEDGLYPEVKRVLSEGAPPVDILGAFFGEAADDDLTAHRLLRDRLNRMASMAEAEERRTGSARWVEELRATAGATGELLRRHIEKENRLIFPIIERMLAPTQVEAAAKRMREVKEAVA